jgi:hypothetical protein
VKGKENMREEKKNKKINEGTREKKLNKTHLQSGKRLVRKG